MAAAAATTETNENDDSTSVTKSTCQSLTVRSARNDKGIHGCPAVNCAPPKEYVQYSGATGYSVYQGKKKVPLTGSQLPDDWVDIDSSTETPVKPLKAGKNENCRSCESIAPDDERKNPLWALFTGTSDTASDTEELNMSVCSALGCGFDTSSSPAATTCTTFDKITGTSIAECVRSGCGYSGSGDKCVSCWQLQGNGVEECNKYGCSQIVDVASMSRKNVRESPSFLETTFVAPASCSASSSNYDSLMFYKDDLNNCQCQPMESFMISFQAKHGIQNMMEYGGMDYGEVEYGQYGYGAVYSGAPGKAQCSFKFYGGRNPIIEEGFCHHCSYFQLDDVDGKCNSVGCGTSPDDEVCRTCDGLEPKDGSTCEDYQCSSYGSYCAPKPE